MDVTIREATIEDGPALAKLRWESSDEPKSSLADFVDGFSTFWSDALAQGRWVVWVADSDGRIVSNIWVYRVPKVPRPHEHAEAYGYVTSVFTVPDARNAGIGAAVLWRVIEWAHAQKLEELCVSPSDESVPFYERAGFVWSKEWMAIKIEGHQ